MKRQGAILAIAAALVLGGAAPAIGQPAKAPAAASAAPSAQPKDAKKDDAKKSDAPPSGSALPAGHPPVGEGLPAGHPPVEGGDEEGGPQQEMPRDPRFFNPPQDTAVDDPSLPAGVIVVTIKDAQDKPLPGAPITLNILHSTVAKGESRERRSATADGSGMARFEGLSFGSGHSYQIVTKRGPATYSNPPVGLVDKAGKRIVVHAYDTSTNLEELTLAMQGIVYLSLREDSIQIEQLLSVYNLSPTAWQADAPIELPKGWKAFNKQESGGEARVDEVPGTGAALRGTFPPGRTDIDFRYQVPLDNEERQSIKIHLPPRVAQARVMAESSRTMGLSVAGFPGAQATEGRDGKRLLITEKQAQRADGGVRDIDIELSGLPTPGKGRWVAVVLALLAMAAGGYYLLEHREAGIDADTRDDLIDAREALLGEIVALERAHKSGEVGPKTYARVRASLLEALGRIVNMLEESKPKPAKAASAKNPRPRRAKAAT
jgi:hypothetical protein